MLLKRVREVDLWDMANNKRTREVPLAFRMRPRNLDEFIGQEHILGEGKILRRAILSDRLGSLIFYGPPGTGKTTLARIIANTTKSGFESINAVTSGVAEIREVIRKAKEREKYYGERTVLFIDEIHRFNKAQQDALLPEVEAGTLVLIGATTENPYFEVNAPLLSRSRIFEFKPLSEKNIKEIVKRALTDKERGLGEYNVELAEDALSHLVTMAAGDARAALNGLELAVLTTPPDDNGVRRITVEIIEQSMQKKALVYDKEGDNHYDTISAFIKSIRGSDPDAAVYYLARMLEAGEDPRFVARRLIVHAAEDIGLADPMALNVAVSAFHALEFVGMPEARLPLAEATLYLACAPKSNAVIKAIDNALATVRKGGNGPIPQHLRDAHYAGAKELGRGKYYKYPHDYPGHFVVEEYLPENLKGQRFYEPSEEGAENQIKKRLRELWGKVKNFTK
ncbi:ATPase AAA [Carboxydothermus pertinax]|uniref:Replication-associated recombination protein A n=1 Tax=Carboxydothermus pertinax TaxID=870242 RepID=A0A1L8CS46_9THEO|nr:ATPase AAA [Carboxydothermus pertinax]